MAALLADLPHTSAFAQGDSLVQRPLYEKGIEASALGGIYQDAITVASYALALSEVEPDAADCPLNNRRDIKR